MDAYMACGGRIRPAVRWPLAALALCGAFLATAMAQAPQGAPAMLGKGRDIAPLCGSKPAIVALIDGSAGNIWRRVTRVEFEEEARRCPNVAKVLYAEAGNDQQKYNAAIDGMVAQGANVIVSFTDFGDASLPVFRRAQRDGVAMVPYFAKLSGKPGKDYSANVYIDLEGVGATWGDWIGKTVKAGHVVCLGGFPGATSSKVYCDSFRRGLLAYPGVKLLDDDYIVTNWNPADAQRAVAGLIAKYKKIDGIASDYGVTALAAVKAFEQAGLPVPPIATIASFNELNCRYLESRKSRPWKYLTLDGTNTIVGFALRRGMSIYQGLPNEEALSVVPYVYADSERRIDPPCDPKAPLDADFSSSLPREKLYSIFKR